MMTLFPMDFTPKHPLVAFREAHGNLSQQAAAEMVGITQSMWSLLESGKGFVRPAIAKRISELTGVSRDSLMNWSDDNDSGSNAVESPKEA
jgi:transcriptional regulator with XRE-family HTH domain